MSTFFKNKYIVIASLAFLVLGFTSYGRMAMMAYYFRYHANNAALMSTMGLVSLVSGFLGSAFLSPFLFKYTKHKGHSLVIFYAIAAIGFLLLYFFPAPSVMFWVLLFIANMANTAAVGTAYGTIPDTVDYAEYQTGVRCDGFLYSFTSFMMKAGGALGPSVLLAMIASRGFVPNVEQSASVLKVLNVSISVIPAIATTLILILYTFYDLSDKKHEELRIELEKRRNQ